MVAPGALAPTSRSPPVNSSSVVCRRGFWGLRFFMAPILPEHGIGDKKARLTVHSLYIRICLMKDAKPFNRFVADRLRKLFAVATLVASLVAAGRTVSLPSAPQTTFADTESVTNAPLGSALASARFLRVEIALTATPSNNVEVAFGTESDGMLPFGEESFCLGWDCGSWFLDSPTNRTDGVVCSNAAPRSLSFEIRVADDGTPRAWTAATAGGGSFTNLPAVPPGWTFSRDWTAVRLVVRGVDERDESVSVRLDTDPGVLILR